MREFFKFRFGIEEDLDFIFHEPPSAAQLQAFASDASKGPSVEDPHFDVKAGMQSEWNKRLLYLLQLDFRDRLPAECAKKNIIPPPRPDKYYGNLIAERFQRLAQVWKQGQPRLTTGNDWESPEQTEERMATARKTTAKYQRHLSRRIYVGVKLGT